MNTTYKTTFIALVAFILGTFSSLNAQSIQNIQVRGDVQIDGRYFLNEDEGYTDTFLIRRARIAVQGDINSYFSFRIMPNFGGGAPDLQDAYIDFKPVSYLSIRAGKFKSPMGLERLQSPTNLMFPELALPTNLVPLRDTGIQLTGTFGGGFLQVQFGLFNGTLDGTDINTDYSSDKDLVGRIIMQPFINSENRLINGFGFGIAGSSGVRDGTLGAPRLPSYSSGGRRNIFRYRSNETPGETSISVGKQSRIAPQLYHYSGQLGVMFEYVASTHNVIIGENSGKLVHTAWNIQGAYLLTGENKSYGAVRPSNPLGNGNGAFEIALRYGSLSIDEKTYPMFSDPARFSETINAWAVGLNWYPTTGTKLSMSYEQTKFNPMPGFQGNDSEKVITTRMQVAF